MFTTLIVQPIFNLLVFIYAIVPGHNFGLSLIIFTVLIRLLLWPLVKKQLHQAKAMRKLQPEIKKIKQATKGNRTKESQLTMELYKERGINQFATIPILIVQVLILIGLYSGLNRIIKSPDSLVTFAYPSLQHLPWIEHLAKNIHVFDDTLFGLVDLSRSSIGPKGIYLPALIVVLGSVFIQYYQSKQLLPTSKESRGLRAILKDAGEGKQADQAEVNAAVGRSTLFILPLLVFSYTYSRPSELSLYWLVGGIVATLQQAYVLNKDEDEMEAIGDAPSKDLAAIPEAEIVSEPIVTPKRTSKKARAKQTKGSRSQRAKQSKGGTA